MIRARSAAAADRWRCGILQAMITASFKLFAAIAKLEARGAIAAKKAQSRRGLMFNPHHQRTHHERQGMEMQLQFVPSAVQDRSGF